MLEKMRIPIPLQKYFLSEGVWVLQSFFKIDIDIIIDIDIYNSVSARGAILHGVRVRLRPVCTQLLFHRAGASIYLYIYIYIYI